MKYLKLRILDPIIENIGNDFDFDDEGDGNFNPKGIEEFELDFSALNYEVNEVYLNCYRIETIFEMEVKGVTLTAIQLDHLNTLLSYLTPKQILSMISTEDRVLEQIVDEKKEELLLNKLNKTEGLDIN